MFSLVYMRGLDGEKSKSGDQSKKSSNARDGDKDKLGEAGSKEKLEEADGDSQFDYVRRMADQISVVDQHLREEGFPGNPAHVFKAIGILGSDVYDKLLILEAMHDKFPDAVFFTNGLDARFQHPDNNKWARNLLQVSGFDLALSPQLQQDIPPFRDSVQTSVFLATEIALANFNIPWKLAPDIKDKFKDPRLQENLDFCSDYPHINEVGRTQPFDFSPKINVKEPIIRNSLFNLIKPDSMFKTVNRYPSYSFILGIFFIFTTLCALRSYREFISSYTGLLFITLMGLISIVVPWYIYVFNKDSFALKTPDNTYFWYVLAFLYITSLMLILISDSIHNHEDGCGKSTVKRWCLPINLLLMTMIIISVWKFVQQSSQLIDFEPVSLFEGISMWPAQGIRLLALGFAGYFIINAYRFPNQFIAWLSTHFNLPSSNEFALLNSWHYWLNHRRRMTVVLLMAILFYTFSTYLFLEFGIPQNPIRGKIMEELNHFIMLGFLVPANTFLLCLVIYTVSVVVGLVEKTFPNDRDLFVRWPLSIRRAYARRFMIDENELHEWVGMRFVSELTERIHGIIGHPLIIILMIVIARSSYFDNWTMPVAMKVTIAFSLTILVYLDFRLKTAVEMAKSNALKSLRERVLYFNGNASLLKSVSINQKHQEEIARHMDKGKEKGQQLERVIGMIESTDTVAYQSFFQRPIFRNAVLILVALLADTADYSALVGKLF